ncbi:hypothetical protein BGZ60DRAFT_421588 [Tricladium varicosporioides]|nr:hypothetical protein BGZ60DRAFT_421588 [Hymenoscyphus varicosporioides]
MNVQMPLVLHSYFRRGRFRPLSQVPLHFCRVRAPACTKNDRGTKGPTKYPLVIIISKGSL